MRSNNGSSQSCRVLLDSGSQANFISQECVNRLALTPRPINASISGINGTATHSSQAVQVTLQSRLNLFSTTIVCIVSDRVTDDLPVRTLRRATFKPSSNLPLADPNFHISSKVDILIGAEIFWDLMCIGQIRASENHPTLQKTRLGWILAGRLEDSASRPQRLQSFHTTISNSELNHQLGRFWQIDDMQGTSTNYTLEEGHCETHFLETVTRNSEGRFVVKMPLKAHVINNPGNSRYTAIKRYQETR